MNKLITKLLLGVLFVMGAVGANAQVTITNPTNTTPAMAATYGSLALAITDVNNRTAISGPVIITLDPATPQTAPAGGYSITANTVTCTGLSATNNFTFAGNSNTITAFTPQTVGSINDGIFKLIGADFITIQNFTLQENAANVISATAATNNMTEFGVALFYSGASGAVANGAQNNIIQNCTISLNRTYLNTFGIYSTSRTTATALTTTDAATASSGSNSGNKVYANSISNINYGIVFIGTSTAAAFETGNDIGGSSAPTGNTMTNWGGGAALSAYSTLTGSNYSIFSNHQVNDNISYNSITSASLAQAVTAGGILKNYSVTQPTGTITTTINNNTVTVTNNPSSATAGGVIGINNQGLTPLLATATMSMNNNTVQNCVLGGSTSTTNSFTAMTNLSVAGTMNMSSNNIINNAITATTATTGTVFCITNSGAVGTLNMNSNILRNQASSATTTGQIQGLINSGAAVTAINITSNQLGNASGGFYTGTAINTGGALFAISNSGAASTCAVTITGNDIRGITYNVATNSSNTYITSTGTPLTNNVSNNTFTNLNINTSGAVTFLNHNYAISATGSLIINANSIVTAFTRALAGAITITTSNSTSGTGSVNNYTNNNFSNIIVPDNASSTILGFNNTDGGTGSTKQVTGNTFNNWHGGTSGTTGTSSTINCMNFSYWNGVSSLSNNTITNITGRSTITGVTIGATSNAATSIAVANNTINNLLSIGTGGSVTGISSSNTSTVININNNTINTLSSTGSASTVNGITIAGATLDNVFKNKIYDLSGNQTGTIVNGINLTSGTTLNIYNNLIGDLRATASTGLNAINGINASATATYNVYYNTIYLNATSSSVTTFGTSCITFSSTATSFNSRNNILYNSSIPALEGTNLAANGISAGLRRSGGTAAVVPANYATSSNNNAYWVNPTAGTNNHETYVEGTSTITNPQNTVANMKAFMGTRDQASIQENVTFQSTTGSSANFLKYSVGVASQLESGAANIATFTDDYIGTIRQGNGGYAGTGTAPDIGAWELEGIAADLTAPSIASITLVGNACGLVSRNVTAVLADASGVDNVLFQPRIYFRKNAGAYFSAAGSLTSGTVNSGTWTFTINYATLGGATVADVIDYFIVAQDVIGNVGGNPAGGLVIVNVNTVTTPPTIPLTYTIAGSLSGTYNVGVAQTYGTLTAAIAAYNTSCLAGAVIFSLTDAAYTTTSDTIKVNVDASVINTLTIKPTLAATTITGNTPAATLVIQGGDYVTIDGSISATANTICPPSAASRDLTIINSNAGTSSAVIWITTNGADGASNNTVKNCIITGNAPTTTLIGVGSGGAAIGSASSVANINNNFINNNVSKAVFGIVSFGTSAAVKNTGTVINQNIMNTTSPNNISRGGIFAAFENGVIISGNTVSNISGTVTNYAFGISCGLLSTTTTSTTGSEVTNATITKNVVGSVRAASTFGVSGIAVASAATGTTLIANNMIADAFANGTLSDIGAGIYIGGGAATTNVYYNSVQMAATLAGGSFSNFGIAINGSNPIVDLRNNIAVNTGSNGFNGNRALGLAYATFTNLTSNYNDFFVSGTGSAVVQSGTLSNSGFVSYPALTGAGGWNTVTTKDANSVSILPVFTSATDLHLNVTSNAGLNDVGTPVSVTDDIDCDTRNATTPDIGADEFTPPVITDAGVTAIVMPNPFCPGVNLVSATVRNFGTTTITSVLIDWSVTPPGGAQPTVNPGAISIAPGASQTFPLGNFTFAAGTVYSITANTSLPNGGPDGVPGNDAFTNPTITTGLLGTYTVGVGMNYTTLTAAVADYNTKSLCGAVIFNLTDATYPSETFPISINANAAASATNTLTIKTTVAATTITGSSASGLLVLNGADYVTIDGSITATANTVCPVSAASRDLTITNTNAVTSSAVIWLQTAAGPNGATNNTVKNCNLTGNSSTTTFVGIGSGSSTISTSTLGTGNNNNSIINNNISKTQFGVFTQGASAANKNTGTIINQNLINTTSPNNVQIGGIYLGFDNGATISGNSVAGMSSSTDAFGISTGVTGWVATTTTGNEVSNASISKNLIGLVQNTGTNSAAGILVGPSATGTNQVSNNMISGVIANSTPGDITSGIFAICGAGATQIYFNTVSMTGDRGSGTTASSLGLAVSGTDPVINIRNNIFVNKQTTASTGKSYAIGLGYATFANLTSNNNDLFTSGANGFFAVTGTLNAGTDQTSLAIWQGVTSQDALSKNVDPVFTAGLHIDNTVASNISNLNNTAASGTGIIDDIDCDTRGLFPDMGADQFGVANFWTGATSTVWTTNANWDDLTVPSSGANITIPTGVVNNPVLADNRTIGSLALGTLTTLSLNGQTLTINGAVTGTGTITGSETSGLTIGGTAGTLRFTSGSTNNYLKNFSINAGASATLGTALNITGGVAALTEGVLTVANTGSLATGGFLTMKSNINGTARVAANTSGSTYITGNVTVERYISATGAVTGRRWHLLSGKSTVTAQNIYQSWQETGGVAANLGTWITSTTYNGTNGYDATNNNLSSIFYHDQATPAWVTPTATNSGSINDYQGYMLFVRGDRSDLPGNTTNSPTVLRTTGALSQGTQGAVAVSATGAGRTLVGNPYASPIDVENIFAPGGVDVPNLDQNMYVWDPALTGNYGVGGFRLIARTGINTYDHTPVALGTPTLSDPTVRFIHSGSAFFLHATGAPVNIAISENEKAGSTTTIYNPIVATTGDQQIIANLMVVQPGNVASLADGIRVRYDAAYNANTSDDVVKIGNFAENISSYREGKKLIVEKRPMIVTRDTIFLRMSNTGIKDYRFQIGTIDFVQPGVTAFLEDTYLNTSIPLDISGAINYQDFSITAVAASANPDRFRIVFAAAGPLPVTITSVKAAQQGANIAVEWKASNQYNMKQYEVEKSTDGVNYTKVNTQAALGTNGSDVTYNWLDVNPVMGNNFYRIRSIGISGDIKISQAVVVKIGMGNPDISIYPNPVVDRTIAVKFTDMEKGLYQLRLVNTLGQVVLTKRVNHAGGSATETMPLGYGIAKGTYQLQIIKPDQSKTTKAILITE